MNKIEAIEWLDMMRAGIERGTYTLRTELKEADAEYAERLKEVMVRKLGEVIEVLEGESPLEAMDQLDCSIIEKGFEQLNQAGHSLSELPVIFPLSRLEVDIATSLKELVAVKNRGVAEENDLELLERTLRKLLVLAQQNI